MARKVQGQKRIQSANVKLYEPSAICSYLSTTKGDLNAQNEIKIDLHWSGDTVCSRWSVHCEEPIRFRFVDGLVRGICYGTRNIRRGECRTEKSDRKEWWSEMKTLYTLSTCVFVAVLIFLGGMYAGTKIVSRLNDDELTELADDFESDLGAVREAFGRQTRLLERANQYLKDSAIERITETEHDRERIGDLESTVERLQSAARASLDEAGDIAETIRRIEQTANGIGEDIQGIRSEVQKIQKGKRERDWFTTTGEYDPEDQWKRLVDRHSRDFLYRNLQIGKDH